MIATVFWVVVYRLKHGILNDTKYGLQGLKVWDEKRKKNVREKAFLYHERDRASSDFI